MAVRQRARRGSGYADGVKEYAKLTIPMSLEQTPTWALSSRRLSIREHGKPPTMSTGCNNVVQGSIYVDGLYTSEYTRRSKERFNERGKHGNDADPRLTLEYTRRARYDRQRHDYGMVEMALIMRRHPIRVRRNMTYTGQNARHSIRKTGSRGRVSMRR
ncbi:uncharacterized protein ARMOST_06183 [Armillaria ostoyae]|uniref:Uncharacterized protein n=1 Tax=Armillaria ostoyae TaxID=47428 RepID=A0A284R2C9_ARMOS|nr:uncharacterized protein ARMOST_06183 [Armillaria ostoyae]